jgi:hypothetical protein
MKKIRKCDYFELIIWLSHNHSGQWSRGYRLMCKLMGNNCHWTSNFEKEAQESEIYQYLTDNYAKKV